MVIYDFYYDFFSTSRVGVNITNEFLYTFLYSITESYDILEDNLNNIKHYLEDLSYKPDGSWVKLNYKQFGFTNKDFNITVNYLLRKVKINGLEIRPGYFKDVLDYFYFIKIIFCISNVAEIISENYDDNYSIRVMDRVYVDGYKHRYYCVPENGKVRIVTVVYLDIYDLPDFLVAYNNRDLEPSEDFYNCIFQCLSKNMKLFNKSTYLNGLCMALLYDDCSKKFPNVKLDKYLDRIQFANEVYNRFTNNL